jgi:TIR domain
MGETSIDRKQFFISYNHADEDWATWIAWQLEQAGYSVMIQVWDFRPGSNFVLEMQQAAAAADRTIIVLSPNYLTSHFAKSEWAASFAQDPEGLGRRLVPVRIAPCEVEGILGQIVYIDLVELTEEDAAVKLMAGLEPGRAKPSTPPPFPGPSQSTQSTQKTSRAPAAIDWAPVIDELPVVWRSDLEQGRYGYSSGPTCLEIHLLPVPTQRLEVLRLAALKTQLPDLGRQNGLFTPTQELQADADADNAYARSGQSREADEAGLLVTRSGQRGGWISLPRDDLGSVLDVSDAKARVAALLNLLLRVPTTPPERFAIAASLGPTGSLTVGSSDIVGRRNSASMLGYGSDDVVVAPEDSVSIGALRHGTDEVAEEIVARLVAALPRQ